MLKQTLRLSFSNGQLLNVFWTTLHLTNCLHLLFKSSWINPAFEAELVKSPFSQCLLNYYCCDFSACILPTALSSSSSSLLLPKIRSVQFPDNHLLKVTIITLFWDLNEQVTPQSSFSGDSANVSALTNRNEVNWDINLQTSPFKYISPDWRPLTFIRLLHLCFLLSRTAQ